MSLTTCHKCWTNPCICGEQFRHMTTDHILSLIDALTEILKDRDVTVSTTVNNQPIKAYLLEKNRGVGYNTNSSLITLLEEHKVVLPDVYRNYIQQHVTAGAVYLDLSWDTSVPYRAAFGLMLYTLSLSYTDTSLQKYFIQLLKHTTCIFDNPNLSALLKYDVEHSVFLQQLFTATNQSRIILDEKLAEVSQEWLLAWSVLTRIESFYIGDLNAKFQAIKEITELISGNASITNDYVFMTIDPNIADKINHLKRKDYELYEMDDDDLIRWITDENRLKQPYFGMLRAK